MKIPTFEEFVNERLFKSSIDRIKKGIERKEDELNESDLDVFNFDSWNLGIFLRKYKITNVRDDFWEASMNVFEEPIKQWTSAHGTMELGFSKEDNCKLPDFEYEFNIDELGIKIFINYIDKEKEFIVFAGRTTPKFDITEYSFGKFLRNVFYSVIKDTLSNEPNLMIKNLKMNFEEFKKLLSDYVYKCCKENFEYEVENDQKFSPLMSIEIFPEDAKTKLNRFLFDGLGYDNNERLKVSICNKNIADTPEGKEIIEIYETTYETCLKNIKIKYHIFTEIEKS